MHNVVCPQCHERLDAPDDAVEARCPYCDKVLALLDTRVTADPLPPSQAIRSDVEPTRGGPNSTLEPPEHYSNWEEFRATSPALQSERIKLATHVLPDMRGLEMLPLPATLPPKVDEFASPLASLSIPGESHSLNWTVGTFIAVIGCFFLVFIGFEFGAQQVQPGPGKGIGGTTITMLIGLVAVSFGLWYAYLRHPTLHVTLWVFENGLFLQRGNDVEACAWEDIKDIRSSSETGRPTWRITTRGNCKLVLSPNQTPAIMPLAEYINIKIASAQLLPKLQSIFQGNRLKFGVMTLDRAGLACPGLAARWTDIRRVLNDASNVFVDCANRQTWHAIPFRDVSFALLLMAIAQVMITEEKRLPASDA